MYSLLYFFQLPGGNYPLCPVIDCVLPGFSVKLPKHPQGQSGFPGIVNRDTLPYPVAGTAKAFINILKHLPKIPGLIQIFLLLGFFRLQPAQAIQQRQHVTVTAIAAQPLFLRSLPRISPYTLFCSRINSCSLTYSISFILSKDSPVCADITWFFSMLT